MIATISGFAMEANHVVHPRADTPDTINLLIFHFVNSFLVNRMACETTAIIGISNGNPSFQDYS